MLPEVKVKVTADVSAAKTGLKGVEASLDSVASKATRATSQTKKLSGAMAGGAAQTANLTAQLNDIGVMLAAGQSPLQLAVQQGTQINQVFAQMGGGKAALKGIASAAISMINPLSLATIGIIAGSAALLQWATDAGEAGVAAEAHKKKLEELATVQEALNREIRQSVLGVSSEELTLMDEMLNKKREILDLQNKLTLGNVRGNRSAQHNLDTAERQLAVLKGQLQTLRGLQEQKARLISSTRTLADNERIVGNMTAITGEELAENANIAELLRQGISATTIEAMQLSGVDMATGVDEAARAAALLAERLHISYKEALRLRGIWNNDPLDPFGGEGRFIPEYYDDDPVTKRKGRGGGGGGGGASAAEKLANEMASRLETLVDTLKTERETVDEWYAEGLEVLASANEKELAALGGHNEAKLRLEAEYQDRLLNIKRGGENSALMSTLKVGEDILNAMGGTNDKALKAARIFGAGIALINAYQAASLTLADPTLPWFARIAAAGSVLAAGIGFASSIKGMSSSGGTASAGSSAGASGSSDTQERRYAEFRFTGGNVLDPQAIVDAMNDAYDQGYQIKGVIG